MMEENCCAEIVRFIEVSRVVKQTHLLRLSLLAGLAICLTPASSHAQGGARPNRPQISPYTAIGSRSPALNYFNVTRPALETRSLLSRQEAEIKSLEKRVDAAKVEGNVKAGAFEFTLQRTGHKTYFSNTSHYYPAR
jgi:hypothetical protein